MIKRTNPDGTVAVTFELSSDVGAKNAHVCGEFNDWSTTDTPLVKSDGAGLSVTLTLDGGRAYRFRYLLDDGRWENDWAADDYVRNDFGGDDSVVDLTAATERPPAAGSEEGGGAMKAADTKKASPAKAAGAKKAAKKAASPDGEPAKKAAKKAAKAAKKAAADEG
jgi:hypothetical protein